MRPLCLLALALLSFSLKAAPATFTLSYASTVNISCAIGDTLKFYGNGNDHYIVNINTTTIVNSTSVPSAPYYIGKHVVTGTDTSYTIGRMSQGMRSGRIIVSTGTSISENSGSFMASVYPNPASSLLNISVADDQQAEIYSVEGKLVMTASITKGMNTIDLADLPKGIYLIYFDGKTGQLIRE